jgi:hypothetical protein
VIYAQFRLLIRIIGRMCKKENWKFVYLTGDTSLDHRTEAVNVFRDKEDVKILIAGLRCGGLGLNFPFANRCVSLDLWWNHAVEQQAFGRIFRLGQKKETYMTRVAVRNTIDMRFLSTQLYKMRTCETAVTEGDRMKLGWPELLRLFGFLKTDKDDSIIGVEPDYSDDEDEDEVMQDADGRVMEKPNEQERIFVDGEWSFGDTTIPTNDDSQSTASNPATASEPRSGEENASDPIIMANGAPCMPSGSGTAAVSVLDSGAGFKSASTSYVIKVEETPPGPSTSLAGFERGDSWDDPMEID